MEPPLVEPRDRMVQPSPVEIMLKANVPSEDEQEGQKEDLGQESDEERIVPNTTDESVRDFPPYVPVIEEQ